MCGGFYRFNTDASNIYDSLQSTGNYSLVEKRGRYGVWEEQAPCKERTMHVKIYQLASSTHHKRAKPHVHLSVGEKWRVSYCRDGRSFCHAAYVHCRCCILTHNNPVSLSKPMLSFSIHELTAFLMPPSPKLQTDDSVKVSLTSQDRSTKMSSLCL